MKENKKTRSHTVLIRLTEEEYETLRDFSKKNVLDGRPQNVSGEIRRRIFNSDSSGRTLLFYTRELQRLRSELHQVMLQADRWNDAHLRKRLEDLITACDEAIRKTGIGGTDLMQVGSFAAKEGDACGNIEAG